jgi:hypothetical protein
MKRSTIAIALCVGFVVLVGAAFATPGMNISGPVKARGTLEPDLVANSKSGVHVKTKGSVDLVTQEITIGPAGHTGWHSHPAPVLVTVKEGNMRLIYADDTTCTGTDYSADDSFIDRGDEVVHIARNLSVTNNLVLWATYFVPGDPVTTPFRIDAAAPGTGC